MSSKKLTIGQKVKAIRQANGLTQRQLAAHMHVSAAYIFQVERGKKPSAMFLDFFACKFGLDAEKFFEDLNLGNSRESIEERSKKYFGPVVAALSLSAPVFPLAAGAMAAGVGVATIILRMRDAYSAKTEKDLAEKCLKISKNTISNWKGRGNIPDKYLLKTVEDTSCSLAWLLGRKESEIRSVVKKTVIGVEEALGCEESTLLSEKKGEIVAFLVDEFIETGEVSQERIKEIVQLAAG